MKKFMVLYMAPAAAVQKMMAESTPETAKAGMDAWMGWAKKHEKSVVDLGMPLGKTKSVKMAGAADSHNDINGYSIVQGESLEKVSAMFKDHPHLMMDGAWVDVIETVELPGM